MQNQKSAGEIERIRRVRAAFRKLNPRNPIKLAPRDSGAMLERIPDKEPAGVGAQHARWWKRFNANNDELLDHEMKMLNELATSQVERAAKPEKLVDEFQRIPTELQTKATDVSAGITKSRLIVMRDYGLDLDDWQQLLLSSDSREWANPVFMLAVVLGIWRALLELHRVTGIGIVHGDLKCDNAVLPIVAGSLCLAKDRSTVSMTMDMAHLKLIDFGMGLSSDWRNRKPLLHNGSHAYPRNHDEKRDKAGNVVSPRYYYVSPLVAEAHTEAHAQKPDKLYKLNWKVDFFSLSVAINALCTYLQYPNNKTAAFGALKAVADKLMAIHDGKADERDADDIESQIIAALNGEEQCKQFKVCIKLLDLAGDDPEFARELALLIESEPKQQVPKPPAPEPPEPIGGPPKSKSRRNILVATASVATLGIAAHLFWPGEVQPLPPPPAETYRDRSARIKQSPWWLSATPPPAGAFENAWLQESQKLSANNDIAARLNLGLAGLYGRVRGMPRSKAMTLLAGGLTLADAAALKGENAVVIRNATCNITNLAIFDEDTALAKLAAPAFTHLAGLREHEAALNAGHVYACRVTPADYGKAADYYRIAGKSENPLIRNSAGAVLSELQRNKPLCYFPIEQKKSC